MPRRILTLFALVLIASAARPVAAAEILINGNFETGAFPPWTVADNNPFGGPGSFFIDTPGTTTPVFGFGTAPNPSGGAFYAVSDSDLPGAHALLQNFIVPAGTPNVFVSFQMFVNDQSQFGPVVDPTGLDPTTGGTFNDNQHARVDILRAGAGDFSTAPGDVIANLYLGVDPGPLPNSYTPYFFDLTPQLGGGGTFRIRFAEVDNLGAINVGVDNVSILAAPEPGTFALTGLGLLGLGIWWRRRQVGQRPGLGG
jgi:PEP-CTERM motif